jgi:hypothetical protein
MGPHEIKAHEVYSHHVRVVSGWKGIRQPEHSPIAHRAFNFRRSTNDAETCLDQDCFSMGCWIATVKL